MFRPPLPAKLFTTRRLICFAGILTLGSLLIIASISYRSAEAYLTLAGNDGMPRLELIQQVLSSLKDAERSHRGFLLTGQEPYIEGYRAACLQVSDGMARLRALTKMTSHAEAQEIQALGEMVSAKLTELGSSLEIRRNAGLEPAIQVVQAEVANNSLDRIRKLITTIAGEELRREDQLARETRAKAAFHQNLTVGLVGLNVLFLVAVGLLGRKISRLEHLVTVCAWSQKVSYEGKWMRFEEFLKRRFGVQVSHGVSEEELNKLLTGENLTEEGIVE